MTFNTPTVFNQGDAGLLTESKHILSATGPRVLHENTVLYQVFT